VYSQTTDTTHIPALILHMPISCWTNPNGSRCSIQSNKINTIINEFITLIPHHELIDDIDGKNLLYDPSFNGYNLDHVNNIGMTFHNNHSSTTQTASNITHTASAGGIYTSPPTDIFNINALCCSDVKI
jgi:hypothetical protein